MTPKNENKSNLQGPSDSPITSGNHSANISNLEAGILLTSFGSDVELMDPTTIAREMVGEFVECSVIDFIKTYLPFAPNKAQTQCIVQRLLQESPLAGGSPDITAFNGWADITKAIASAAPEVGRQVNQFKYHNMPNKRLASGIRGLNNRIDAGFIRKGGEGCKELSTTDIAVVIEHRPLPKLYQHNALKAVSANVQIMNDDARRMFTFGITVESSEVILWYHCRSHSAVSKRFNLVKKPHLLLRVLAAFSFATEEQLGYDPMITREQDGRYTFKLPDPTSSGFQNFRTIKTLSEYRTNNITGRMTRVYTVNKLDGEGKVVGGPLVLKDVWLDKSAKTEGEIQKEIFKDIEEFWARPTDIQEMKKIQDTHKHLVNSGEYKKYFLEIVLDHVGTVTTERPRASTLRRGLLLDSIWETDIPKLSSTSTVTSQGTGTSSTSVFSETRNTNAGTHPIEFENIDKVPVSHRPFDPKKRYQVIFKDVCRTVGQLKFLGEVVEVLRQTLIPLQLLLCAGWVHRDISSGNILAHRANLKANQQPWQAKLADFEYAKKFSHSYLTPRDPKTGTPYFMPLEVMFNSYLYDPRLQAAARGEYDIKQPLEDFIRERKKQRAALLQSKSPKYVIHNFQHDLESVWWILLWTVTCRIYSNAAFAYGRRIFVNQNERRLCFTAVSILDELEKFLPTPKSEDDHTFAEMIENLRDFMNSHYISRVAGDNQGKPEHYVGIFNIFTICFNTMERTASDWAGIHLIVDISTQNQPVSVVPGRRKRTREEESIADARQVDGEERSEAKMPKIEETLEDRK
ncbi:hypothetical protein JR316_0002595 [Psilocybe cubensis]|uniref:Uncharacterized protein n=1 Tax=Psilocybe cubensis TaxID=181762 RepID=A0ACB8HD79_PSICU|nr:hypothetical protein JR316_0002595 [Psilocybe cubensis]KAH9485685.1 hypothetical protein JR316_0002595 [Psilocybe cubensis]